MSRQRDTEDDPEDPRPITISELVTKLMAVLAMMNTEFGLPKIQRGVCHPGGTHQACVEIQQQYDKHTNKIIATFDVKNAFNDTLQSGGLSADFWISQNSGFFILRN